jgi:hypothetical protein
MAKISKAEITLVNLKDGINSRPLTLYNKNTSTTAPASFSGTATYTFSTNSLTGLILNGWTRDAPTITNGENLWLRQVVATSTSDTASIPLESWSAAAIVGAGGVIGRSVYTAIVFQRSATAPAAPTTGSFDFGANTLTVPAGWYLDVPTGTNPVYGTRFVFSVIGNTGVHYASTWSTPFKIAENGIQGVDGSPGADGTSTYQLSVFIRSATAPTKPTGGSFNFGTQAVVVPSGWSATIPTGTNPVYVSNTLASVPGVTGIDSTLTWSDPVILARNGDNGLPGESAWPATGNAVSGYNDLQSNASVLNTNNVYRLISSGVISTQNLAVTTILHLGYSKDNDIVQKKLDTVTVGDYVTATVTYGATTVKFAYIITSVAKRSNYGLFNNVAAQYFYEFGVLLVKSNAASSTIDLATGGSAATFDFSRAVGTRGAGWWRYPAGAADLSTMPTTPPASVTAAVNSYWAALHTPDIDPVKDDRFVIATTHVSGTKAFVYNGTDWVTQTAFIDGNLLVAGTVTAAAMSANSISTDSLQADAVTAEKIDVTQLSAISATIGTLRTSTSGARMEIYSDKILVYDANGNIRVKMGNLL